MLAKKHMTVIELITKLKTFPPNAPIDIGVANYLCVGKHRNEPSDEIRFPVDGVDSWDITNSTAPIVITGDQRKGWGGVHDDVKLVPLDFDVLPPGLDEFLNGPG